MMNVSGGRLLLFVIQLTDGPHITFSILDVALNNCLYYISAYLMICVILPRGVGQPAPYTGRVGALWVGLNNVILCKYRDCFRSFEVIY